MAGNYPPGTSAGDPNAPWNAPDPPTCPDCGNRIMEPDDHGDDCPLGDADEEDLIDRLRDEGRRTWDDVKEDPTPAEADRYDLDTFEEE